MAGSPVSRSLLDQKASEAIVATREAFRQIETIAEFLNNAGQIDGVDALVAPEASGGLGYTEDEAYLIRSVIQNLNTVDVQPTLLVGRKLTGLQ